MNPSLVVHFIQLFIWQIRGQGYSHKFPTCKTPYILPVNETYFLVQKIDLQTFTTNLFYLRILQYINKIQPIALGK